jgi:glycosyltransferase involved in cell wall biosynthesis
MKTSKSLVSVVLCTYNGSAFIGEQLKSILLQTYHELEIIIVDDSSTDNTFDIIEQIAVQDSRIRCFRNPARLGYNKNYEKALQLAQGQFIAVCDQDDVWRLDKIEILLSGLVDSEYVMIYCHSRDFTGPLPVETSGVYSGRIKYFEGADVRKLLLRNSVSGHCMLFRQHLLEYALPLGDVIFYDFWLAAVACCNGGIKFCNETLVYRRRHEQNASFRFLSAQLNQPNPYGFLVTIINKAVTAPNIIACQEEYGAQLSAVLAASRYGRLNWKLFLFVMNHRHIVFHYKPKKIFSFFSHLKHSLFIAKGYLFNL